MCGSVYRVFPFILGSVYRGFAFIRGSVDTGFPYIRGSDYRHKYHIYALHGMIYNTYD
jgi:hypothetical protein